MNLQLVERRLSDKDKLKQFLICGNHGGLQHSVREKTDQGILTSQIKTVSEEIDSCGES